MDGRSILNASCFSARVPEKSVKVIPVQRSCSFWKNLLEALTRVLVTWMFPCTGTLCGSTMAVGPRLNQWQLKLPLSLVESGRGSLQLHKQNKVQVPDVLDSLSLHCWSRASNLGICTTTLVPRSQDISILVWGVFLDKYLAVGYFPPVNFYLQFKVAHVQNLKPLSSMQGWHLFPSFQMPTGWVELLFIGSFLPATSLFATFHESADPFTSLRVVLFSQWMAFSNGFAHSSSPRGVPSLSTKLWTSSVICWKDLVEWSLAQ